MKTNTFLTIISIVLAALVGYLAFHVASGKENDIVCGMYSTICFAGFVVKMPYYIIVNGIVLVIYLAIFYKMKGIDDI